MPLPSSVIGCWYPDAPTPLRLWENVLARRRAFRRLPRERLPLDAYYDPDARSPDKTYGRNASLIDGFEFDWIGRRIPRRTFEGTDIAHWLALEVATRSLYFTRFFKWMGKMREVCGLNTPGAYVKILDMLRSNEITSATNAFETTILSTPRCNDIIEGRLWAERASAVDCDAVCEWWAVPFTPNEGDPLLIAWSHMTISAVQVLQNGAVRATKWPDYFYGFLELMGPRGSGASRAPSTSHDYGACRFKEIPGPRATGVLLADQVFDTSFEDSNIVGNIYFASYGVWQGRLRDRFFYELSPETFSGLPDAELICTNFRMTQLREAMPFDRVRVEMRLAALYERAADLSFHYFRVAPDGSETKLAVGEHTAVWATPIARKKAITKDWPAKIIEPLFDRMGERRPLAS